MKSFSDYNIILINLDGLRKDKLNLCPNLMKFKENSLFFSNMISVSPYTLTAHHALMSGTYPCQNGVDAYYHMFRFKKNEILTLPELLKQRDYYTVCDVISKNIIPEKGFDEVTVFDEKTVNFETRHSEIIKKMAMREKFFLFLHYEGIHSRLIEDVVKKYDPKLNDNEYFQNIKENHKRYNSCLPDCDRYVNTIIKTVEELPIKDQTILIFLADHGTSVGEKKGEKFYGVYVYDYTINTFCMIKIPTINPRMISTQCRIIDIFPTILDLIGIEAKKNYRKISGQSLLPLIEGNEKEDREVFVETGGLYGFWPSPKKHNVFCIRMNNRKLIYNDTPKTLEYYNLKDDPQELENIYDDKSVEILEMKQKLVKFFEENNLDINLE